MEEVKRWPVDYKALGSGYALIYEATQDRVEFRGVQQVDITDARGSFLFRVVPKAKTWLKG